MATSWWIFALLSAFFAALTAIFAKIGIKGVDSDLATAIRTVVILLLAWGIAVARGATAGLPQLTGRTWIFLVLSGLATGASWLCYFRALKLGPVSKVAPVDKLSVALSLLLAVVFLGEVITWKGAVGAGLILAGTLVLIGA
jgi:transporter family protein